MANIATLSVNIIADTARFTAGLRKSNKQAKEFARNVKRSLVVVTTIGAVLGGFARQSIATTDRLGKLAKQTGLTAETIQELRFAAQQSGVDVRGLDDSIRRFTRRLGLFQADGGGPAATALKTLNIAVTDVKGNLRGAEPVLNDAVKALGGIKDAARLSALASQLFGDDFGPKLVPLLAQGAGGIANLRKEARDLGIVISNDAVGAAEDAENAFGRLKSVLSGNFNKIVADFAGQINVLVDALTNGILKGREFITNVINVLRREWTRLNLVAREKELRELLSGDVVNRSKYFELKKEIAALNKELEGIGKTAKTVNKALGLEPGGGGFQRQAPFGPNKGFGPPRPEFIDQQNLPLQIPLDEFQVGKLKKEVKEVNELSKDLGFTFSSAFEDAVLGAEKLRDVLKALGQDILRIFLRKTVTEPLGNFVGSLFSSGVFGGARADGGPISPGKSFLVGERGPELITPGFSGTVHPFGSGGGNVTITNNIDARGADAQLARALPTILQRFGEQQEAKLKDDIRRGDI